MKRLFTSFFVLGISLSHAQSFDHIIYKQEVNQAYELAVKQKKYTESLKKLETVKKNYQILYGEDYRLQAYCYKMLGNDSLAAVSLKTCWSVPSFDMRTLWYVAELDPAKLMEGFNEYQSNLVQEGFDNFAKNRPSDADSIIALFHEMDEADQLVRNKLLTDPDNEKFQKMVDSVSSKHEDFIENYVRLRGFPGEKQLQLMDAAVWLILIHSASTETFYQRMKPVFLEEVRRGNMSPIRFANWVDQHQFYYKLPSVYQSLIYVNRTYTNTEKERKQISRNRFEIGLMDLEFTNPRFE